MYCSQVSTVRLNLGNDQYLYFSTFADYSLKEGQFSLNGFFAMKIDIQKDRFVSSFFVSNDRYDLIIFCSTKLMNSMNRSNVEVLHFVQSPLMIGRF